MSKDILVLYWHPNTDKSMRIAIRQHLHALDLGDADNQILYLNTFLPTPNLVNFLHFDAIILYTTLLCLRWSPKALRKWQNRYVWVKNADCLKIAIPQDEYDHSKVLDNWLDELDVSIIFTNFDETVRSILYPTMHEKASFRYCYTGYIDAVDTYSQRNWSQIHERELDIVYRASHLPYWFGSHGQLKHEIADIVAQAAQKHQLQTDISTKAEDVITGTNWYDFMASGKATIGTESGSSVLDEYGEIRTTIKQILLDNPRATFEQVNQQMPSDWDSYEFFALSPRHFEAVKTKTCQILMEGDYGGVFVANQHYLPLKRDFSNLDEILVQLEDTASIQAMVDRAYDDIYLSGNYTYASFAEQLESAIDSEQARLGYQSQPNNPILWKLALLYASMISFCIYLYAFIIYQIAVPIVKQFRK